MAFEHGRSTCSRCWTDMHDDVQEMGAFKLVRDPGHWGASEPHTLVLGISKGNTQSRALASNPFDQVGFKGIRPRMLEILQSVGLLHGETSTKFDRRFSAGEQDFAFASVVRCSITGLDKHKGIHTADSPNVIPAFDHRRDGSVFAQNCVDQHLVRLPERTKSVILLGNTDAYVNALLQLIERQRGQTKAVNSMAYTSRGVIFVHVAHPSKGNGHFGAYLRGEGKPGLKRDQARQALTSWST